MSLSDRNDMPWWAAAAVACVIGLVVTLFAIAIVGMVAAEVEGTSVVYLPNWPFLVLWAVTSCVATPLVARW